MLTGIETHEVCGKKSLQRIKLSSERVSLDLNTGLKGF